jgi:translation initiation factor IF-2
MLNPSGKPTRLAKVAKETNVALATIADFLKTKDIEIEVKPTTKLDMAQYKLVLEHFKPDLLANLKVSQEEMPEAQKPTIALESLKAEEARKQAAREKEKAEQEEKRQAEEAEAARAAELAALKAEKELQAEEEAKAAEQKAVAAKKEEKPEAKTEKEPETEDKDAKSSINVLGKIDLANLNTKNRPDKKGAKGGKIDAQERKRVERQIKENEQAEEKKAKAAADKAKKEADEAPKAPATPKEEHKTKVEKLSGPTVLGKIELPVDKKPVRTPRDEKRPKRKRIAKVDVNSAGRGTGGYQGRSPGGPGGRGNFRKGGPGGNRNAPQLPMDEKAIKQQVKNTLAKLNAQGGKSKSSKNRRAKREVVSQRIEEQRRQQDAEQHVLKVTEFVTAGELASMMDVGPTEVVAACMSLGLMVAINQRLDAETLQIVAEEFGYAVEFISAEASEIVLEEPDTEENLKSRPPIVTVMGHVDHGKTSLLDFYRNTNVIGGEAGGITQHIGAYSIKLENDRQVTFLDTPGHEAFTAMRARGAQVTDLCIIVIAADDSIMPQTREAINHAQAAEVPMVFAINKIDKDGANPDKIREELSAMNILVEDWGGKYQCQEISAKKGLNMDALLEKVLLESDLLELKADSEKRAVGTVVESALDKGRGYVTTIMVQAGTLKIGDYVLAGTESGKIKAMQDEWGKKVSSAGPSMPLSVLGLSGAVSAGDKFYVLEDEREARQIATKRQQLQREQGIRTQKHLTLDEIGRRLAIGDFQELNIILKGDVDGSIQALSDALVKLSTESIQVNVIHKGVGPISDSDVLLATASSAIIVGFQVRPVASAKKLAEREEIDIRLYSIIYDAINDVKEAMEGMLSPEIKEEILGTVEVRETFRISKVGTIAGCFVTNGKVHRNSKVRIIRQGVVVHTGLLGSLKRFKDDVKEVGKGYECGLNIDNYNDIKEQDIIEVYKEVEVKAKL